MSIEHVGTGRIVRSTALPTTSTAFTVCGWARITGTRTGFSSLFELLNTGVSGTQINFGVLTGSTTLQLYVGEGGATSGAIHDPGADAWFFWAITQSSGDLTLYIADEASTTWDATWSTTSVPYTAPTFTPNLLCLGGANNTVEPSLSICSLVGVWNEGKTSGYLLGQKQLEDASDTGASLLSYHVMDGADLSADLTADRGTSANFTTAGTGTVYSALYPTVGASITGTFEIPVRVVDSCVLTLANDSILDSETTTATVLVLDDATNPFEGISVSLSSDDTNVATIASSPLTTDSNGEVVFTINGVASGTVTISADADSGLATDSDPLVVAETPTPPALASSVYTINITIVE